MRKKPPREASPFQDWIHTASVRAKPSLTDFKLSAGGAGDLSSVRWFVFGAADELMAHPALRQLDMAQRNRLYGERLVHFLDDMALTEHRIVNHTAQILAENRLRAYVPEPLALDALKLYTDEGYHAYFTAEASRAIREVFGLPVRTGPSLKIATLETLAAEAAPAQQDLAWFFIGFVGETMVTKAIVDVMRGSAHSAIQTMLLAHLEDEWVHARYFAQLFELIWPRLDAAQQTWAAGLLPRVIAAFHTWDEALHRAWLRDAGLDATACERVLEKLGNSAGRSALMRAKCGNTLQVLERCGVFSAADLRHPFIEAGLLDRDHAGGRSAATKRPARAR